MANRINKEIEEKIKKYINEVKKRYSVDKVIVFGSYAKGNITNSSDIDLAIVSPDIKDRYDDMAKLMGLTWGIDTRIEPHPIKTEDFNANEDYFIREIQKTGISLN